MYQNPYVRQGLLNLICICVTGNLKNSEYEYLNEPGCYFRALSCAQPVATSG